MPSDESWLGGFNKHTKEWADYTNRMKRMHYDMIEHDFTGPHEVCQRCGTHRQTVMSGMASWLCTNRTMPCCGQMGNEKWDSNNTVWKCSQCGSTTSTDYSYKSWKDPKDSTACKCEWKKYEGLVAAYEYCTKCDKKRDIA